MNSTQHEPMGDPQVPQQAAQAAPETGTADPHLAAEKPHLRTGPIVWGALFLVFCAFVVQRELAPGFVDPAVWIVTTVIGLGVLLLAAGIAVVVRGASSR